MAGKAKLLPAEIANDPDGVLEQAEGQFKSLLILGWNKEGDLEVRGTPDLDGPELLWMIEHFKAGLMAGDFAADTVH